jgi:DNA-binding transcriptional ArsR family regulator
MEMSTCKRIFADSGQIADCKETIKENQQGFSTLSAALTLAGNEVRFKILFLLRQEKELCPCDLGDILDMTIPAISQHLGKLRDGGLIQSRKSGQTIFYSICASQLSLLQSLFNLINQPISTIKA